MKPPPSRYRIEEKGGRLIVYDNGVEVTGRVSPPANGASAAPPASARPSAPAPRPPMTPGSGWMDGVDALGGKLARVFGRERDSQGRMILSWSATTNGKTRHYRGWLDARQERNLGRGLAAFMPPGALILLGLLSGGHPLIAALSLPVIGLAIAGGVLVVRAFAAAARQPTE